MDFLGLLKDIISMVVIGNLVTGNKHLTDDEDYLESLERILTIGEEKPYIQK